MIGGFDTAVHRGPDPGIISTRLDRVRPRAVVHIPGLSLGHNFRVHNNSLVNVRRALCERVFHVEVEGELEPPPRPLVDFSEVLKGFSDRYKTVAPSGRRVSYEEFVDLCIPCKRRVYKTAVEDLYRRPIEKSDSFIKAFVKAEKVNVSKKPDPAPRIIQPRSPRYNVEVGRFLKPLEHNIYEALGEMWGSPTVMKGYNARDTAALFREDWDSFNDPVAIGLDASRFDQHVSIPALKFEHRMYQLSFHGEERRALGELLRWQLRNNGVAYAQDGKIKYKTEGCRMSGDMNTALGNCLLMCAMLWQYCHDKGINARLKNNGDDCVITIERSDLNLFSTGLETWFLKMGFTMKVEPAVDIFEEIEFCQTHPVFNGVDWIMCRNPFVCSSKDLCWIEGQPTPVNIRRWMDAVGRCGASLSSGLPVLQEFYQALIRNGLACRREVRDTGFAFMSRGLTAEVRPVSDAARISFYKAFSISGALQRSLEEAYSGWCMHNGIMPGDDQSSIPHLIDLSKWH